MLTTRTLATLLAAGTAATLTALAPAAVAAPPSGSAGGSSSGCGPRSSADYRFLRESYSDEESCDTQDDAIRLAHADCQWLDAYGNTAYNHIVLAEKNRAAVDYPYIFLDASIDAYCPHNQL
jgi:hypothetical protein